MNVDYYSKESSCITYFNIRNCAIECIRDGSSMQTRTESAAAVGSANRLEHNLIRGGGGVELCDPLLSGSSSRPSGLTGGQFFKTFFGLSGRLLSGHFNRFSRPFYNPTTSTHSAFLWHVATPFSIFLKCLCDDHSPWSPCCCRCCRRRRRSSSCMLLQSSIKTINQKTSPSPLIFHHHTPPPPPP